MGPQILLLFVLDRRQISALGPVVPDESFTGSQCPLMAGDRHRPTPAEWLLPV
jgi:hypothetical protein